MKISKLVTTVACFSAVTLSAADFARTTSAAQLSMSQGFSQSSLPLLNRAAGINSKAANATLLQKLCSDACSGANTNILTDRLQTTGDHWMVEVLGDGTAARFRDLEVEAKEHSLAKDSSQKLSAESLEQSGRAFINSKLGSVILLGAGEELVPVRTDYLIEGGQDVKTRQITRSVVANRMVFGRTINGVPVVGGGSTVVLTFANDGAVESFQYDWPSYQATSARSVVDSAEILHRVQQAVNARTGVSASNTLVVPSAKIISPVQSTTLQKLECGYYDPGASARDAHAPVQSGCVYHAVKQDANGMRQGFAGAVPGAQQIEPDDNWTEAHIVQGMGSGEMPGTVPANSQSK